VNSQGIPGGIGLGLSSQGILSIENNSEKYHIINVIFFLEICQGS
jgi:hypothetical protein